MGEIDVEQWLAEWAEEILQTPGFREDRNETAADAMQCREEAKAVGISEADLLEAAGGDLEAYLLDHQNSITDDEVKRLADKDG